MTSKPRERPRTTSDAPATLRWAVRLLGLEAVATGGLMILIGYQAAVGEAASRADGAALAGFVLLVTAALAGLAVALARRKPRARAPAIVLQLFGVMFGVVMLTGGGGSAWLAGPMIGLGAVVATLLLAPGTTAVLGR